MGLCSAPGGLARTSQCTGTVFYKEKPTGRTAARHENDDVNDIGAVEISSCGVLIFVIFPWMLSFWLRSLPPSLFLLDRPAEHCFHRQHTQYRFVCVCVPFCSQNLLASRQDSRTLVWILPLSREFCLFVILVLVDGNHDTSRVFCASAVSTVERGEPPHGLSEVGRQRTNDE